MKRSFVLFLILLAGGICQAASLPVVPQETSTPAPAPAPALSATDTLRQQKAAQLPGAQVSTPDGRLTIAYPQSALFAPGAVLPFPGGAEVLDPLADYLRAETSAVWEAKVLALTANGSEYDLALAQKRSELLQRYLRNRGMAAGAISWQSAAGDGAPLTLTLLPTQVPGGSSSGVKK